MTRSGRRVYKARTAGTMFHVKHSGLFIDEHHLTRSRSQATRAGGTLGVAREGEGGGQVTKHVSRPSILLPIAVQCFT